MVYYSAINKKETLPFATTWMTDKHCMSYMWNLKVKLMEPESRTLVTRDCGMGKRLVKGYRLSVIR